METITKILIALLIIESLCFPSYIFSTREVDHTDEYDMQCNDTFMGICFDESSEFYKVDLSEGEYNRESYEVANFLRSPRLICG